MQSTFYVVKQQDEPDTLNSKTAVPAHFDQACKLAANLFREGKRVFIYTESEQHAHLVDEHLWGFEADAFVPHNLAGEGPRNGAPVEISFKPPSNHRAIMINLATLVPGFVSQFRQIIDFVPADEQQKQAARERYKFYRQCGYQLSTTEM
ncbi:MAG: DNA polymerase III subunit chi [Algicola sp.]|nr:DNA polymerase III subunit chi [Algicola sp.]